MQVPSLSLVKKVYQKTVNTVIVEPALCVPFLIFAAVETAVLFILFLAPRAPLRVILGPIISRLWGEAYLHYPTNFILLPRLGSSARMFLAVVLSSLLTGMAVMLVNEVYHKKAAKLKAAFKAALSQYISLFAIVLIFTAVFYFAMRLFGWALSKYFMAGHASLLFIKPNIWMGPIAYCFNFMLALFIQSFFIYAIPILMIDKEKLIKAIFKSFLFFKKFFFATLLLVGLPMLVYIPITVLEHNSVVLIQKLFPEIILLLLLLGIAVSSLVIDLLVTISAAVLYLDFKSTFAFLGKK